MLFRTSKVSSLILDSLVNIDPGLLVKVDTKVHVLKEQVLGNKPELEISLDNMVSLTLILSELKLSPANVMVQ